MNQHEFIKTQHVVSNILRASAGNMIEWFDFYSFIIFATYFSHVFFASGSEEGDLLNALGVFAAGFIMRPIGSWFFGRYADRNGRKTALTLSILMMAGGSLLIAVSPGVNQIGWGATLILCIAKLIQGFSVGGEYGTSATYMSEIATRHQRGFFSSFQYLTLISGQVIALLVQIILQQILSPEDLYAWGWRIPFFMGAFAGVTVMWLRRGMDESLPKAQLQAVNEAKADDASPGSLRLLKKHWRSFLVVIGMTMGGTISFYTFTSYMQILMLGTLKDRPTVTAVNLCALFIFMCLQPVAGLISDKIGRKPLLLWFGIGGVLFTWPIMSLLSSTQSALFSFFLMMAGLIILLGYTSINALVKSELFPREIRALGVGLGYGIANAIFGGTVPYIGKALNQAGLDWVFYLYVTTAIGISLIVYLCVFVNKQMTPLDLEEGSAFIH